MALFEWKIARTMAHLHMDGNFTGISLPFKAKHPEIAEWRAKVLAELNLPPLPTVALTSQQSGTP